MLTLAKKPQIPDKGEMSRAVQYGALAQKVAALCWIGLLTACGQLPELGLVPTRELHDTSPFAAFTPRCAR